MSNDKLDLIEFEKRVFICHGIISDMCKKGRGFKMQVPAKHDKHNEDLYMSDTLDMAQKELQSARAEIDRLSNDDTLIFHVVAEIREIIGVGRKPMLSELPDAVRQALKTDG